MSEVKPCFDISAAQGSAHSRELRVSMLTRENSDPVQSFGLRSMHGPDAPIVLPSSIDRKDSPKTFE